MAHCFLYTSNDYLSAETAALKRARALISTPHDLLYATNAAFEPDPKKKENVALSVNSARAICRESLGVPIGEKKVFVFTHADLMTLNAQNALLKLFEEPPENVFFFLITDRPSALLPTVRSRCVHVSSDISALSKPVAFNQLEDLIDIKKNSDRHRIIAFCLEHKDEKREILDTLEELFRKRLLQNEASNDILKKIAVARMQASANCNWNAIVWRLFQ